MWDISKSDFIPEKLDFKDLLSNLAYWILPGFVSFAVFSYLKMLGNNYFNYILRALNEGISVYLWNLTGTLGLIFLGISIVFIKNKASQEILRKSSDILLNTFKAGLLAFGVLAGETLMILYGFHPHIWWQKWFFDIMFPIMLLLVLILNLILWYISILIYNTDTPNQKTKIMEKIELMPTFYRLLFSICFFIILPIITIIIER